MHRIATSPNYRSSLHEIQTQWSAIDLIDAIEVDDMLNDLNAPEDP